MRSFIPQQEETRWDMKSLRTLRRVGDSSPGSGWTAKLTNSQYRLVAGSLFLHQMYYQVTFCPPMQHLFPTAAPLSIVPRVEAEALPEMVDISGKYEKSVFGGQPRARIKV